MKKERKYTQVAGGHLSLPVITLIVLFIIAGISLYIRIALPYDQVFRDGWVAFKGADVWYHMRHIDNLVRNFPHVNSFDPYMLYPGGGSGPPRPFFDWLVAGIAWLVALGSPSQHAIDLVGAYLPAILGTLIIIPVYFIGKELFNRWVGFLAAALAAILPGEFLHRSLLGFTDHHVAESLFATLAVLFLILAVKRAREREISFSHFINRNWGALARPLTYALLAGIFLGIYLLSWRGGLLVVFIIFAWIVIQFIIDHLRHKSTDYLCIIGILSFFIATIMLLPILGKGGFDEMYRASLLIAIIVPMILSGISRLMKHIAIKPVYYLPTLLGLAGIGLAAFHAIDPSLLHRMLSKFNIFTPSGYLLTLLEAQPLLLPYGHFSLQIAWLNFTTSFFISFISLGFLIYTSIKRESADKTLFLVWSIIMLAAVLGRRRFSYYFAINAALLTGYFSWRILNFAGLGQLLARPEETIKAYTQTKRRKKKAKVRAGEKALRQRRATWTKVIVAGIVVFFLVFFPNIGKAKALAKSPPLITEGWYSSLLWLKGNTPKPLGDPDSYYDLYTSRQDFEYPESAYGVLSWRDYGYWIMRIAHRIPNFHPGGGYRSKVARFFLAQDEYSANGIANKMDSKYVIVDNKMSTSKFYAIPRYTGSRKNDFYETYYRRTESGKLKTVTLFYPAYYRSMVVRLYNFDGKAVTPEEILVISYEEKLSKEGVQYKEITGSKSFPTYQEAEAYISAQKSGNYRIVSTDPLTTPVPLEELNHYKLIHQSDATAAVAGKKLPEVKIFERVPPSPELLEQVGPTQGLVGYWPFKAGTGSVAFDWSKEDNDGAIHGATWDTGVEGTCLSFDGTDDYVEVPDDSSLDRGSGNLTISVWVKHGSTANHSGYVVKGNSGRSESVDGAPTYCLRYYTGGAVFFIEDGSNDVSVHTTSNVNDNEWHYIVGIRDGNQIKIYVDGQLENSSGASSVGSTDNTFPLAIGESQSGSGGESLNGSIDEVRIYNRVLTDAEVKILYQMGRKG